MLLKPDSGGNDARMPADDELILLDGTTFFYSDSKGDVEAEGPEGYFFRDVRHLSRWLLRLEGHELEPLTSRRVDYFSARIVTKSAADDDDAPPVALRRDRFVTEGTHEDIVLESLVDEAQAVTLELLYGADFADVMEAQSGGNGEGRQWHETTPRSVTLWSEREGYRRGTAVTFNRAGRIQKDRATFRVELEPRQEWKLCVDITPIADGKRRRALLRCDAFHEHAQ